MMDDSYILNILIVGFHHKRGVQLEYCYPPLFPGQGHDASELPEEWQNLPYLALPDGAHNYEQDHVYFVLPSLTDRERSVFCVACYRQIDSDKLVSKSEDVTRSSVQKSVVVVSRAPLFGAIRQRLSHVAESYFELRDFSRVEIMEETFMDFKRAVTKNSVSTQVFSVKELLLRYRQKLLVLFKLILLERRVLVHMNPASQLGNTLLTLASLYPSLIECGLSRCGAVFKSRYNFRNLSDSDFVSIERDTDALPSTAASPTTPTPPPPPSTPASKESQPHGRLQDALGGAATGLISSVRAGIARVSSAGIPGAAAATAEHPAAEPQQQQQPRSPSPPPPRSPFDIDDCGFPLALFAESAIFLPYVSLQQIGLLEDANVRACLLGANNVLFRQPQTRRRIDALLGADAADFAIYDRGLARLLRLTGPDEAFIQRLLDKATSAGAATADNADGELTLEDEDLFAGSEWEGSDDWLRAQFRAYLTALLLTADSSSGAAGAEPAASNSSLDESGGGGGGGSGSSSEEGDFNASYVRALRATFHYRAWLAGPRHGLAGASRRHPCHGQSALGVRLNQFLTGTDQGRKVSSAVQSTGRALEDTGKVVGGAIYNAGSAMSGFLSGLSSKAASRLSGSQSQQQLQQQQQQQPPQHQEIPRESSINSG
uniref:UDENN domain-containing protein n=1 Tax=Macrostomum lignano TaxID=282301 RepID=A0A1I8J4S2_9PLAT